MERNKEEREYYENGNIKIIKYYVNDLCHRDNGPAIIKYYENGNIQCEIYYLNGKLHRENGPAYIYNYDPEEIFYYKNGIIEHKWYYLNDIIVTNIYNEVKQILKELSIQYKDDLEMIFKLRYNDLYYQVFQLIQRENEND